MPFFSPRIEQETALLSRDGKLDIPYRKALKIVNVEASRPIKLNERTERMNDTHKFVVGDKVRVNGVEGVIHALIPFTFIAPAYDVRVTKTIIIPVSERSIEKIEQQESEIVNDR